MWPRDPLRPGMHYFFFNNALAGILILIEKEDCMAANITWENIMKTSYFGTVYKF